MNKKPELLAPAGNLEKLKTAIDFGADAVYLGGNKLNLRAFADNFGNKELEAGIKYAHDRNKKVHVTLNVFPHNQDMEGLEEYLKELYELGVDAAIVADPGIIMTAREVVPNLELHLSTQANNVNYKSAIFWHKQGVKRIVLARELSMTEVISMREKIPETCDIEAFIHGSMCMAYSGRCLLSNYLTGRDSNRGACAQPCRYKYYLVEEKRPGEYYNLIEDDKGSYIMNSKDLCMIEYIPELVKAGITSFKIEGRMKSSFYVASVVKAYREAIDSYFDDPDKYKFNPKWMKYLDMVSHRQYYTGFYFNDQNKQVYESSSYIRNYDIVGVVKEYDAANNIAYVEQRNKAFEGDTVEILRAKGDMFKVKLENLKDEEGNSIESTPVAQMQYSFICKDKLSKNDLLVLKK
ncbi:peptidase U32 family protein [Clostridium oryzae]|uniref:Putative protease YhbU n=1 Tax=Clostridium oryzae TaxID=1450648 RepID=A0A1V4IUY8_9CLOT|nr:U32 family peptidase [Clostridium oryzae]OPJ63630.1 putative protease YhbU precursor [Clostridium oryzae]